MKVFEISGPFNLHDTASAPNLPGLYVWYARFHVGEADWHSEFADGPESARHRLVKAMREHSMKFARQEMAVQAKSNFSMVWKGTLSEDSNTRWRSNKRGDGEVDGFSSRLELAVEHDRKRELLVSLLDEAFPLFCSPLYLGKATEQTLRSRLSQHRSQFLKLWERCVRDREYSGRIEDTTDFARRAIKLGYSPEDLYCFTLSVDAGDNLGLEASEIGLLVESAEWLLNRWATPILGRQ